MLSAGQDWTLLHTKVADVKPYCVTSNGPRGLEVTDEDGNSSIITFSMESLLEGVNELVKATEELKARAPALVKAYQERYGNGDRSSG